MKRVGGVAHERGYCDGECTASAANSTRARSAPTLGARRRMRIRRHFAHTKAPCAHVSDEDPDVRAVHHALSRDGA